MDEFKILYFIIAAVIFIVSRVRKANKGKKPMPPPRQSPRPNRPTSQGDKPVPTSLEEMLEELGKSMEKNKPVSRPVPPKAVQNPVTTPKREPVFETGRDRRFADEESKRIYEESIKRAEGFDLEFNENDNYKTKRTVFGEGAVDKKLHSPNPLIKALREDLKKPESVKKAFILSEVFNRRYV